MQTTVPQIQKSTSTIHRILKLLPNYIPRLSEWLSPFFKLLKETFVIYVPWNLLEDSTNLKQLLKNSCQLALRQPLRDKQLIFMSEESFTATGYATTIEEDPDPNAEQTHL